MGLLKMALERKTDASLKAEYLQKGYIPFSWVNRTIRHTFEDYYTTQAEEDSKSDTDKDQKKLAALKELRKFIDETSPSLQDKIMGGEEAYYFNDCESELILSKYDFHLYKSGFDYIVFEKSRTRPEKFIGFIKINPYSPKQEEPILRRVTAFKLAE